MTSLAYSSIGAIGTSYLDIHHPSDVPDMPNPVENEFSAVSIRDAFEGIQCTAAEPSYRDFGDFTKIDCITSVPKETPDERTDEQMTNIYLETLSQIQSLAGMSQFSRDEPVCDEDYTGMSHVFTKDYTYEHTELRFIAHNGVDFLYGFWVDEPSVVEIKIAGRTVMKKTCIPDKLCVLAPEEVIPIFLMQWHHTTLIGPITRILAGIRPKGMFNALFKLYSSESNMETFTSNYIIKNGLVTNLPV